MVELGFVENCEPWRLESRFFPSKVGGKPAWLDLKNIPNADDLACDYCHDPCIFLCQIYAPIEDYPNTFHRTIYVFICKKIDCCRLNQNGNLKVFRSQLSRSNIFYPSEPPTEDAMWRRDIDVSQWTRTCNICGIPASILCNACMINDYYGTIYCSDEHKVYDFKNGHNFVCGRKGKKNQHKNSYLFPEYEIVMDEEEEEEGSTRENAEQDADDVDDVEDERKEIAKYNTMIQSGEAGTLQHDDVNDDLLQMAGNENDETFAEFRAKIHDNPSQILRYDRGGNILYISSHNQLNVTDVPKCSECNGERQFEFQLMPQLLNFFDFTTSDSIDWGILAVFTCKQFCTLDAKYAKEYIWKQDIVQEEASGIDQE